MKQGNSSRETSALCGADNAAPSFCLPVPLACWLRAAWETLVVCGPERAGRETLGKSALGLGVKMKAKVM